MGEKGWEKEGERREPGVDAPWIEGSIRGRNTNPFFRTIIKQNSPKTRIVRTDE